MLLLRKRKKRSFIHLFTCLSMWRVLTPFNLSTNFIFITKNQNLEFVLFLYTPYKICAYYTFFWFVSRLLDKLFKPKNNIVWNIVRRREGSHTDPLFVCFTEMELLAVLSVVLTECCCTTNNCNICKPLSQHSCFDKSKIHF